MAETTTTEEVMSREECAIYLRALANECDSNEEIEGEIGTKTVTLSPDAQVETTIEVGERSAVLGDPKEVLSIEIEWAADQ